MRDITVKYTLKDEDEERLKKITEEYNIYHDMLKRCYYPKYQERYPTYKGCKVEDYLLNFQHMGEWIDDNYYEIPGEKMCLDKDILCKGNKMYSRDTCIFVPNRINVLFTKRDNAEVYDKEFGFEEYK